MSKKKTPDARFQKALDNAKRPAAIYGYHTTKYHDALKSGLSERAARGAASKATAAKFSITRRQVEIIVGDGKDSLAAKERKLMQAANGAVDLAAFDERAGVLQWLSPKEMSEAGSVPLEDIREKGLDAAARAAKEKMRPLPELARLAIPHANAEVRRLEIALREAENREKQIVGKLLARTRELEGKLRAAEKENKRLTEQLRDEDIARAARNMGTRRR